MSLSAKDTFISIYFRNLQKFFIFIFYKVVIRTFYDKQPIIIHNKKPNHVGLDE